MPPPPFYLNPSLAPKIAPRSPQDAPKIHPKIRTIFGIDFGPIWSRSGTPTWRHFRPFCRPRSAKFGPKRVWKAGQHEKRDLPPNTRPRVRERKFQSQDGLQNAPRSAQDGSKKLLENNFLAFENRLIFGLVLGAVLDRFWLPKPSPHGPMIRR